jgi:hypothetical protein
MKKIMSICSFILFVVVGLTSFHTVYAIEAITVAGGETEPNQLVGEPMPSSMSVVQKTEYPLPFPGMLPDHPLYFLKRFRDTVLEKLISDPMRKTEFYILQSDKRLQMGISLMDSGKGPLGESTVSKGEKYMEQAVSGISMYKKNGGVVPGYIIERLERATAKHEDVIKNLIAKAGPSEKTGLEGSLTLLQGFFSSIQSLK